MPANTALTINNLDLLVNLGWPDNERIDKQTVHVNILITFPEASKACDTDDLADTVCYDALINALFEETAKKEYKLIEQLSKDIHRIVKTHYKNNEVVTVNVTKHPAIQGFSGTVRFSYGD